MVGTRGAHFLLRLLLAAFFGAAPGRLPSSSRIMSRSSAARSNSSARDACCISRVSVLMRFSLSFFVNFFLPGFTSYLPPDSATSVVSMSGLMGLTIVFGVMPCA